MWSRIFGWIATNLALPIFWEFVKRYSERKKFIESADVSSIEDKCKAKAKEDGWDVT